MHFISSPGVEQPGLSNKEEKMEERKRIIGTTALSFSILCLALAIGYFGLELNRWRLQLPEILKTVSDTSGQIAPVLGNISKIEKIVPEIIDEVEAVRKTVDDVLSETEKTREMIPSILEQVRETNSEVAKVRELVPPILEEVRKTREELPSLMDRADRIIASADEAGEKAGKGAMTGIIGGILSMPFSVVGELGKGVQSLFGSEVGDALNQEDLEIFRKKIIDLAEKGEEGDVATWENPKTSNGGKITLLKKYRENGQECRQIRFHFTIKGKDAKTEVINGCKQPDGSWVATK